MIPRFLSFTVAAVLVAAPAFAGAQEKSDAPAEAKKAGKADDGPVKLDLKSEKAKKPAQVLPGPIAGAEVARALEGVVDNGYVVNHPAVESLLRLVKDQPLEPFRLDENENPISVEDLIERPSQFRGKLVGIVGSMVQAQTWDLPGAGKVLQVLLNDAAGNTFTVLLPEDPGHRNATVRLRGYFVRVREIVTQQRWRPSPVLVARTWDRIIKPVVTDAEARKSETPDVFLGKDGKPTAPDPIELVNLAKDLEDQMARDPQVDTNAMWRLLRWCVNLSADKYKLGEDDAVVSFRALTEHPATFMTGEPITVEGVVRSIEQYPDATRRSGLDKYWVALLSHPSSRAIATVVLAGDPGPFVNPYHVKFRCYMVKTREFETKNGDRGFGPVLTAPFWTVTQGPVTLGSGETPTWLKTVMSSKAAMWAFIGIAAVVLMWVYVSRKSPGAAPMSAAMARLPPAEPLMSKEVIDTLARMPNSAPPPASDNLSDMPETKPEEPAAGGNWPPSGPGSSRPSA
jgi:hypothetical protein